ncbi:MAG: PilZ domain-containing protein [Vicinamibacterales bacterium]
MPAALTFESVSDRRHEPRLSADVLGLDADARLTVGVHVRVVNVSRGGALVEQEEWLRPGTRTELRLTRPVDGVEPAELLAAPGVVARCWVHRLSPLRYRTALVFATAGRTTPDPADGLDPGEVEVVLHEKSA